MSEHAIEDTGGKLPELVTLACDGGERVLLTRHGKIVAAVISLPELRLFEELRDHDADAAVEEMAREHEEIGIPLDQAKAFLARGREAGA